jgi:hypothetical protein
VNAPPLLVACSVPDGQPDRSVDLIRSQAEYHVSALAAPGGHDRLAEAIPALEPPFGNGIIQISRSGYRGTEGS